MLNRNSHHKEFSLLTEKGELGHPGVMGRDALRGHTKGIFKPTGAPSSAKGRKAKPDTQHQEWQLCLPKPGTQPRTLCLTRVLGRDMDSYRIRYLREDGFTQDKAILYTSKQLSMYEHFYFVQNWTGPWDKPHYFVLQVSLCIMLP